mmetsp:Transcript_31619/g.57251  ORF Transcript_31619/g.57251 Transcript_31619/m.57251 type:complete len:102 (-) Transcript_31619:875-1180(-)
MCIMNPMSNDMSSEELWELILVSKTLKAATAASSPNSWIAVRINVLTFEAMGESFSSLNESRGDDNPEPSATTSRRTRHTAAKTRSSEVDSRGSRKFLSST